MLIGGCSHDYAMLCVQHYHCNIIISAHWHDISMFSTEKRVLDSASRQGLHNNPILPLTVAKPHLGPTAREQQQSWDLTNFWAGQCSTRVTLWAYKDPSLLPGQPGSTVTSHKCLRGLWWVWDIVYHRNRLSNFQVWWWGALTLGRCPGVWERLRSAFSHAVSAVTCLLTWRAFNFLLLWLMQF